MAERDHHITLDAAVLLTHTWQQANQGKRRAWMLPRTVIDEILKQPECSGIRMYAAGPADDVTVVVVGTDAKGNDLTAGVIAEVAWPCPPWCSDLSRLLSID